MAVRIPDLDVGDDAVSCTLSFNRSPFFCYMPWKAVFALVAEDGKAMIWPADIPKEVAAQQAERAQREQARAEIRAVPSGMESEPNAKKAEPKPAKKRGARARTAKPEAREAPAPIAPIEGAGRPPETASPATSGAPNGNGASGARARSGEGGERREKRPLPSYLRVVK
jgi:hypothetical protein